MPGETDTKEVEALAASLNRSAERVQTLWLSFLTFTLYLAIAAGTTTHPMLFREDPLNLPVLNIKLPLLGFYVLAPMIFVLFHFYMLINLVLLARTAHSFDEALGHAFPRPLAEDEHAREHFRMRIENTLFVQLLVGGRPEREGSNARLLSWMALITLALAPVALLLFIQIRFLPYHSEAIAWIHRGLLVLDLYLVWLLWPAYRRGWGIVLWPTWRGALLRTRAGSKVAWSVLRKWLADAQGAAGRVFAALAGWQTLNWRSVPGVLRTARASLRLKFAKQRKWALTHAAALLTAAAIAVSFVVATFPDEAAYRLIGRPFAWAAPWPNKLDVHGEDLIDEAKLHEVEAREKLDENRWEPTLHLDGRDLTEADLSGADIRHAAFTGATLKRAHLARAWATGARFDCDGGRCAQLQGVSLLAAQLQGASLDGAQLQSASLVKAQLEGASLNGAALQGASFLFAQLQGASLIQAQLQGASFVGAQLEGAALYGAQLQGASFVRAQLQGASLAGAGLQGALLLETQLQGASFTRTCVWRAYAREADLAAPTAHDAIRIAAHYPWFTNARSTGCNWTAQTYADLKKMFEQRVPVNGVLRDLALKQIAPRLDPGTPLDGETDMAKIWRFHAALPFDRSSYEASLKQAWSEAGCDAQGAPYVLRALLSRLSVPNFSPFAKKSVEPAKLARDFLETSCAGAKGLSDDEIAQLTRIRDAAPPAIPKP